MIDVCLLLEGTYPFVAGGVSTWVHQLISAMKDIRFGIVYISPNADPTRQAKYEIPDHVVYFKEVSLHDYDLSARRMREPDPQAYQLIRTFYENVMSGSYDRFGEFIDLFSGKTSCFDVPTLFHSEEVWELINYFCDKYRLDVSFLDLFWTFRGTHLPVMSILQTEMPKARIYHSISTGYAGLLGAMARVRMGGRYFLTEHGIYTHERMLEISQANWIFEKLNRSFKPEREMSFFKRWWIKLFDVMSQLTYRHADRIFTLYEGNKTKQILQGAVPEKITVIPNGINIGDYQAIVKEKKKEFQIGLVGRVVPIKDVKTYIDAAKIVLGQCDQCHFYIIGPTDEEEDYYQSCRVLVESYQLENKITFTGGVNIKEYYRFLDLLVLTSVSEAQPYVILEANVVGIPVVATNVGACREMLDGTTPEDRAFGPSGLITEVTNALSTAEAILRMMKDETFYNQCSEAGRKRVARFYDQDDLLSKYLNIYEQNMN